MYNNPGNDQNTSYPIIYQPTTNTLSIHSQTPFSNVNPGFNDHYVAVDDDEFPKRDERFPQWSYQETRDLIEIRAQLEWDNNNNNNDNTSKRRRIKNMWEMVVNRMRNKGYRRTSEQCKGKWKNLLNRYKNRDSDPDSARQFPFFEEMDAVFAARGNRMQHAEQVQDQKKHKKRSKSVISQEDFSSEEIENDDVAEETNTDIQTEHISNDPKAKSVGSKRQKKDKNPSQPFTNNEMVLAGIKEMMTNFMHEQETIDAKWRELSNKREQERDSFEEEWREKMKVLEKERLTAYQAWKEREEQRRVEEQSRAEKRDEILTLLLKKMTRDGNA